MPCRKVGPLAARTPPSGCHRSGPSPAWGPGDRPRAASGWQKRVRVGAGEEAWAGEHSVACRHPPQAAPSWEPGPPGLPSYVLTQDGGILGKAVGSALGSGLGRACGSGDVGLGLQRPPSLGAARDPSDSPHLDPQCGPGRPGLSRPSARWQGGDSSALLHPSPSFCVGCCLREPQY